MPVTIETSGNNSFPAAQVGDIYYGPNLFGVNLNNEDGYAGWTVPCGPQVSNGCYEQPVEGSAEDTGQCTACWRIPDNGLGTNGVRGYMFQLFGSLGGRKETHGVPCGTTGQVASTGRLSGCNYQNGTIVGSVETEPVFDMRDSNANIGLPERVDQINNLSFCFSVDKECSGTTSNIENVFIDTYLHRIYQPALYPVGHTGSDGVAGNWGDLNKINENATETWNINFKLCLPEFSNGIDPGAQATGGVRINNTPITIDGRQWGVYFKWENFSGNGPDAVRNVGTGMPAHKCLNSFFYISFVPWSAATGQDRGICNVDNFCINYDQFLDWVGSQEFKDRVLGQNGQPQVPANRQNSGQQAHWPLWVWQQVGQPRFVVDSPESYVLDGIGIGNELWYSPTNTEACVCWEDVQFTTDAGVFGKNTNVIEPTDLTCNNNPLTITPNSTIPASALATDGTPGYTISNFQSTTGNITAIPSAIIAGAGLQPGTYNVSYTITDNAGDSVNCFHTITYTAPNQSDLRCTTGALNIVPNQFIPDTDLAQLGTQPYQLSGFTSTTPNITGDVTGITASAALEPGTYQVTYAISDAAGGLVQCALQLIYTSQCVIGCGAVVTVDVPVPDNEICIGQDAPCIEIGGGTGNTVVNRPTYDYKTCNSRCCQYGLDSAILWCNLCLTPGAVVTATGVVAGSESLVCECEDGLFLDFEDELTYTITLPSPQARDSFIVHGHDLCDPGATIEVTVDGNPVELKSHDGTVAQVTSGCGHCGNDDGCNTVALHFKKCVKGSIWTVTITAPGRHRINRLGWHLSWEVELEEGYGGVFNASRYELDYKDNSCSWLGVTREKKLIDTELVFTRSDRWFLKDEWRPVRNYMERGLPWYWAEDRNCPDEIGLARLSASGVSVTPFITECEQDITIPIQVNVHGGLK